MKLLGLGDNVVDYYINEGLMYPGGNAVNVAAHAALLGHEAAYLGNFGEDEYADIIRLSLTSAGVSFSLCPTIPHSHTKLCLYNIIKGERQFVGTDTKDLWSGPLFLTAPLLDSIRKYQLIHSCSNAKMEQEMHKLSGLPAIFTYDFSEKEKYRTPGYLNLICPFLDLALFSCNDLNDQEMAAFACRVRLHGAKNVLITAGSRGQYFSSSLCDIHHPVTYVKAKDTIGAGDAFLASFVAELYAHGWRKGQSLPEDPVHQALESASTYSGSHCMREGGFGFGAFRKESLND